MDRVYDLLLSLGYSQDGIDWLRRHRALTILVLAVLAWLPVIGLVILLMRLLG